jgi:hypothetical protein
VFRTKPDVEIAIDRLAETWETTRDTLAPRLSAAREAVTPYVDTAAARLNPVLDEAKQRITPAVERIAPAVDTARARLRSDVVPAVIAAAETARETSAPARAEAKERASGALHALRGERPQKVRRWPVAAVCLLAGAAAGAVVGSMRRVDRQAARPTTTPFPTAATPAEQENPTASHSGTSAPGGG